MAMVRTWTPNEQALVVNRYVPLLVQDRPYWMGNVSSLAAAVEGLMSPDDRKRLSPQHVAREDWYDMLVPESNEPELWYHPDFLVVLPAKERKHGGFIQIWDIAAWERVHGAPEEREFTNWETTSEEVAHNERVASDFLHPPTWGDPPPGEPRPFGNGAPAVAVEPASMGSDWQPAQTMEITSYRNGWYVLYIPKDNQVNVPQGEWGGLMRGIKQAIGYPATVRCRWLRKSMWAFSEVYARYPLDAEILADRIAEVYAEGGYATDIYHIHLDEAFLHQDELVD